MVNILGDNNNNFFIGLLEFDFMKGFDGNDIIFGKGGNDI